MALQQEIIQALHVKPQSYFDMQLSQCVGVLKANYLGPPGTICLKSIGEAKCFFGLFVVYQLAQ